jgi:hypothetical protein
LGITPITSTFLAIKSSMARSCSAGSSVVGLMIEASTPSSFSGLHDSLGDVVEPGDLHLADNANLHRTVGRKDDWRGQNGKRAQRASALHKSSPSVILRVAISSHVFGPSEGRSIGIFKVDRALLFLFKTFAVVKGPSRRQRARL